MGMEIGLGTPDRTSFVTLVKWKLIVFRLELVLISRQDRCKVSPNVPWALKSLRAHQLVFLGGVDQVKEHFSLFGDSVNLNAR
jgi:hypothetical protein